MKILLFIPAYNCKNQINRVINSISPALQKKIHKVLVVDNHSTDGTLEESERCLKNSLLNTRYELLLNKVNFGFGGSKKIAFNYAINNEYDFLIELHGDDQANIADITEIIEKINSGENAFWMGARFMRGSKLRGYSFIKNYGNRALNFFYGLATGSKIFDLGSGLNVYSVSILKGLNYINFPNNLTFNYVFLLLSYHKRVDIKYFPILWRNSDQVSNVKIFSQAAEVMSYLIKYITNRDAFLTKQFCNEIDYAYNTTIYSKSIE